MEFITTKQEKYAAECEVRAILTSINPLDGGNRHIGLNGSLHRATRRESPSPLGTRLQTKTNFTAGLLQGVVISPWAEPDEIEEIELWTKERLSTVPTNSGLRSADPNAQGISRLSPYKEADTAT